MTEGTDAGTGNSLLKPAKLNYRWRFVARESYFRENDASGSRGPFMRMELS